MGRINNVFMKANSKVKEVLLPVLNKSITIEKGLSLRKNVIINCNGGSIIIGKGAFINSNSSINSRKSIKIGNHFLCGENVHIYDHNHLFNDISVPTSKQGFKCKSVVIGDNVWIGSNVTILAGVTIGNNCIIGANCLIHKSIPDNSVVKCNQELIIEKRAE